MPHCDPMSKLWWQRQPPSQRTKSQFLIYLLVLNSVCFPEKQKVWGSKGTDTDMLYCSPFITGDSVTENYPWCCLVLIEEHLLQCITKLLCQLQGWLFNFSEPCSYSFNTAISSLLFADKGKIISHQHFRIMSLRRWTCPWISHPKFLHGKRWL